MTRFLFATASALFLLAGAPLSGAPSPDKVAFPAAAGVRPGIHPVGPALVGPDLNAGGTLLTPNDMEALDRLYNGSTDGGDILDFATSNNGNGSETVFASDSVGSGVTYTNTETTTDSAVSPNGTVYYVEGNGSYEDIVAVNPSTKVRTRITDGSNTSLGTQISGVLGLTWDFATGTIVYLQDGGTFGATGTGVYRVDPATGIRTAVSTNSTGSGGYVVFDPSYIVTDAFGNIFYLDTDTQSTSSFNHTRVVVELPVIANSFSGGYPTYSARKVVSSNTVGSQTGGTYQDLIGLSVDTSQAQTISGGLPTAESLIVVDQGTTQTNSAIYRVPTDTGNKTKVISFNSTNANTGTAVFDLPSSCAVDTTGRIYYGEYHNGANDLLTVIPAGTHAAATLTGATGLGYNDVPVFNIVPPPVPTLATGTTSNVLGSTATLSSSVTADGGSAQSPVTANAGIISRGFVYALTSTNATPKLGGTGVTSITSFVATALPVATNTNLGTFTTNLTSLSQGASYTFSAYAQDQAGYGYSTPVAFTTATIPTLTTAAATSITGTSATLGGSVTSAGGGSATITGRGIVYSSTSQTPTIGATGVTTLADASAATGAFTDGTGSVLANGTTYYYRAYATNQVGTNYGSVNTFVTIAPPTANSQSVNVPFNTATAITLTGTDPNSPAQTLTYAVTNAPTHGTLSGTAPNLTYTPTSGYHGADSFTFTVTNTSGLTSTSAGTVSITVAAGTPTATAQSGLIVLLNTPKAVTLAGTDPDSPALPLTYTVATQPANGTLSGTAPNLTYTPNTGYTGTDSFTFTASNGQKTSPSATVSLTVVGEPYVTSFTASGAVGSTVTITGNNFLGMSGVTFFRNVAATTFMVASDTQMTVVVPTGAMTGVITLTNGLGTNTTSTKFTVSGVTP